MGDVNLDEIAEQELLNEAKRGAARASVYGALGWQKCPLKPTNKVFLQNILLSTLSSKRRREAESDAQDESMKRKLSFAEFEDSGCQKRTEIEKKSVPKERQTLVNLRECETASKSDRESDEKFKSNSGQKYSRSSNSGSALELYSYRKRRREQSSKSVMPSKQQKDSKNWSNKKRGY